jgi:transposase
MVYIGIDISKMSFDVACLNQGQYHSSQYPNTPVGFLAFVDWATSFKAPLLFCLEATGIYGLALAKHLHQHQFAVIVANPIKTHAFSKMEMARNKTDKADAQSIARYCQHLSDRGGYALFTPKDGDFERLQFLVTRLDQLETMRTQENNRISVSLDKAAIRSIKAMLAFIEKQKKQLHSEIQKLLQQNQQLKHQVDLLTSISGVGDKTAYSVLAYLGDIASFKSAKQVSSYAGLNPRVEQSGTSLNRTRLSKMGHARLRKSLYMPALVAVRFNPLMVQFYQRLLAKGKQKKVALAAVMRKLLVLAYGILKSNKPFDVNYQNTRYLA